MLFSLLLACSTPAPTPGAPVPVSSAKPDVVLITLDTTRADRLGSYGYAGAKTETLDRLANSGLRFTNTTSPLPLTIPAHSTIMTGLLPWRTKVRNNGDGILAADFTTLAERLKAEGWNTGASVAAFVTSRQWGFGQGFDAYFDQMPEPEGEERDRNFWHLERDGKAVVDDALNWLASQPADKPVFLWVHLYDPHFPYDQHSAEYGDTYKDKPYDGELAYVDDQVERLTKAFEGRDALWVVIGDHGEALGEHHEMQHGFFTYQATQHVPFFISGHGVPAKTVEETTSSADVLPTVLTLLGMPVPDGLDGHARPGGPAQAYAESYQLTDRLKIAPHRTLVVDGFKLIDVPRPELYDLTKDPGEKTNLAEQMPDKVKDIKAKLAALNATPPSADGVAAVDAQTMAQLAQLGYMSGDSSVPVDYSTLPDPKDYGEFIQTLTRLDHIQRTKGPEEALKLVEQLSAQRPEAFELRMRKMMLLQKLKRVKEIRPYAETLAKEFPEKSRVWLTLASLAMGDKDFAAALEHAEKASTLEPKNNAARELVVEALFRLRRNEDAVKKGLEAMEADPLNYGVAALLGQWYLGQKDFQNAEKYLRVAVNGPNPRRASRAELAVLALAANARTDALKLLEAEVKDYPGNLFARNLLQRLYGEDQRWLDQKAQLEFMVRVRPKDVPARLALSQVVFNLKDYTTARALLDPLLKEDPENPDVLLLHANLLAKEGKKEEGFAVFQKAEKLNAARVKAAQDAAKKDGKGAPAPSSAPAGAAPKK